MQTQTLRENLYLFYILREKYLHLRKSYLCQEQDIYFLEVSL